MEYRFLSKRVKALFSKNFGDDFDLVALASRPREVRHNVCGKPYLRLHYDVFMFNGLGDRGLVEVFAELAAAGFVFHEGLTGDRPYRDDGILTRKSLIAVIEMLATAGIRNAQLDSELAYRLQKSKPRTTSPEEWARQKRKAALTKRIAAYREKIAKAEDELRALGQVIPGNTD